MKASRSVKKSKTFAIGVTAIGLALGYAASQSESSKVENVAVASWDYFPTVAALPPHDWGFGTSPLVIHYLPCASEPWHGVLEAKRTRFGIFEVRSFERVYGLA